MTANSLNFRQLECFFAVSDHLHFGRAAAELHLSQASVSEAVSGLERQIGAPLLHRTTRRVSLTTFGEYFLAQTKPPWDELHKAYGLAKVRRRDTQEIVLAHTPELGHLVLPRLIEANSENSVTASTALWRPMSMHTHTQVEKAGNGGIDIGLCWAPVVRHPLAATRLAHCPFAVVLRANDELAQRRRLALSELRGRRIVVSARQVNMFIDAKLQAALLQSGLTASSLDEVEGYEEVTLRVATRGHVGIHPASIVAVNRTPGIAFRPLDEPDLTLDVSAIHRQEDTPRLATFIDLLRLATTLAIEGAITALNTAVQRPEP